MIECEGRYSRQRFPKKVPEIVPMTIISGGYLRPFRGWKAGGSLFRIVLAVHFGMPGCLSASHRASSLNSASRDDAVSRLASLPANSSNTKSMLEGLPGAPVFGGSGRARDFQ